MSDQELPETTEDPAFTPRNLHPERPASWDPVVLDGPSARHQSEVPRLAIPKKSRASKRRKRRQVRARVYFFFGIAVVAVTAWSVWDLFAAVRMDPQPEKATIKEGPSQLSELRSKKESSKTTYVIEPSMSDRSTPQLAKSRRVSEHLGGGAKIEAVDKQAAAMANASKSFSPQPTLI